MCNLLYKLWPEPLVISMTEDNKDNLVDFTVIKLTRIAEDYREQHYYDMAQQVEECLASYLLGTVTVIWKEGLPYVKDTQEASKNSSKKP